MVRPKHTDKALEALIRDLEKAQWEVTKGSRYYKARCACGEHMHWIHCTPSNPNYPKQKRKWLETNTCWDGK